MMIHNDNNIEFSYRASELPSPLLIRFLLLPTASNHFPKPADGAADCSNYGVGALWRILLSISFDLWLTLAQYFISFPLLMSTLG